MDLSRILEVDSRLVTGKCRAFDPTTSFGKFLAGPPTAVPSESSPADWYRLGDAYLGVRCEDDRFLSRFRDVYGECQAEPSTQKDTERHVCIVRYCGTDIVHVTFEGPPPPGGSGFLDPLLQEMAYLEQSAPPQGWRAYRSKDTATSVAFSPDEMVLERRDRWPWLVANAAVNRVLATQAHLIFFHGATIGIGDSGVLILGPAGAGKTTLALALAARGHSFLSDEIAGVRLANRQLIPLRRSSFVRPGPAAAKVMLALDEAATAAGGGRRRAPVGDLFPDAAPTPVTARYLISLRRFANRTHLERFSASHRHLSSLNPLACSMITDRPGNRIMQVLSLMSQVECYFLDSASPDSAADAIERLLEE